MTGKDGLEHRVSWAGAGNGVLFFDPDGRNAITEERQYVFTEWNPTAAGDLEALRSVWDTNGDGKLTAADAEFAKFKVLVTNADGSTTVQSLTQLGITEIDLTANAVNIEMPDGSAITGQTTFTRSNGSTGTVANATLISEAEGHRVVEVVTTDGTGNRVATQTGYSADGGVAFRVVVTTSPSGHTSQRLYDDNGDGVTDRVQSLDKVTLGNGSVVETLVNRVGAEVATAIIVNRTVTTTSADGKLTVIERDSLGGGWFDQRETWTINADGSRTEQLSDLAQDGSVIRSVSETVAISGNLRSESADIDGDGDADAVTSHAITVAGNLSRTEVVEVRNGDGTLRAGESETVSADGRSRVVASDLDGDGDVDRTDEMAITVAVGGVTTSVATVKNGNGSLRSTTAVVQSADALVKTTTADVDGDGDIDLTTVDATVINVDGSRVRTVTATNSDGSVRGMSRETLGADKVTAETWVDLNQDGVFQATDLAGWVTVDASTQARTETVWARNADGSVRSQSIAVTSSDGLSTATTIDADGDGDVDTSVSDVTVVAGGVATRTVEVTNQDGSLRSREVTATSADGLTITRAVDIDGDGDFDSQTADARVLGADGSVTLTTSNYAGDGTTLTRRTTILESADRQTKTVTTDADGDGFTDSVIQTVEAEDGSTTVTQIGYYADGAVASESISTISANGLVRSESRDVNGDGVYETATADTTILNADGSQVQTVDVNNGDGSNRSLTITEISDDGLLVTTSVDSDGDGIFDRTSTSTTVLTADGSRTTTVVDTDANDQIISQSQVTLSDDGLVRISRSDADGDGDFNLVATQTTVLLVDGGTQITTSLRDLAGVLRSTNTTTTTDDGRFVTVSADLNGDDQIDSETTRIVADNGTVTETISEYSQSGELLSRERTIVSDEGLLATREWDRDGDGVYERRTEAVGVRNADGSMTQTSTGISLNGSQYVRSVEVTSDDGLASTRADDVDGDGADDLTTTSILNISTNGIRTSTTEVRSGDDSLIERRVIVTSSDRRTVTQSIDLDGNGVNDRLSIATTAANGEVTTTTNLLSTGGTLEAQIKSIKSGDGLVRVETVDRNGDGWVDRRTTDTTELGSDGTVQQTITYHNGRNVLLASEERFVSDDGLERTVRIDADGDGVFEARNEVVTTLHADGSIETVQRAFDGASDHKATITTVESGDGLARTTSLDYSTFVTSSTTTYPGSSGSESTTSTDGVSSDRVYSVIRTAEGAVTEVTQMFGAGYDLQMELVQTVSADGRTRTMQTDLDGDGTIDRDMISVIDFGRDETSIYRDLEQNGAVDSQVTLTSSANGLSSVSSFDVNGDGEVDFIRTRNVTFAADGSEVVTFSETHSDGTLGYESVTTTSANGLASATQFDIDGDGSIDGTTVRQTILNEDGSKQVSTATHYAEGDLRSNFVTEISSDGRTTVELLDFDGNGISDKIVEMTILADGSKVEVETAFDTGGMRGQVFTTVTSADGLETSFSRSGNEQTIVRSALNNGSYTWNNGVTAALGVANILVTHEVDAFGIETWTMTETSLRTYTWQVGSTNEGYQESATRPTSTSVSVRLDEAAKARVFSEAARIYDTFLDRDIDFIEREQLLTHIVEGVLDQASLASSLLSSAEFSVRYGTLNNAEFLTQIYLNSLGRAPSLVELDEALSALSATAGTPTAKSRAEIALEVSESLEHVLVGNGHLATNNFDVIINPAQFERSLDEAYTRSIAERLVDTVFDRDATEQELDYLSERLLKDISNPDDLVALLFAQDGDIQGVAYNSLKDLTGGTLVKQAFLNALGRQPTALEQQSWEGAISAGRISVNQFVASLSMSIEKTGVGNTHVAWETPIPSSHVGTSAGELIDAGSTGSQVLQGLGGNDTLKGGGGNDIYVWSVGDGNDLIDDATHGSSSASQLNTDVLRLTDVASTGVKLTRVPFADDLRIEILATGEFITVKNHMLSLTNANGIEAIEFSDGVAWSLDDIKVETTFEGNGTAENAGRGNYVEHLFGRGGNDTLNGSAGNDTLVGGADADLLKGGAGSDTYVWSRGEGADTIEDTSNSTLEVDRLILTNVTSSEVTLLDSMANRDIDIIVRVDGADGADILVKQRDYELNGIRQGRGIEVIEFSDGVIWTLEEIFDRGSQVGTGSNETFGGTAYQDHYKGNGGQDTLNGLGGDDTLDGGTGNDSLVGGNGADTYIWRKGDGNDTINDSDTTTFESDVLILEGVTSDMVELTRANGSVHLVITIEAVGSIPAETITVLNKFNSGSNANSGIEEIRFSDGVIWHLADIRSQTSVKGTNNADVLSGTSFRDNLFGGNGADTLNGGVNDDLLVGGLGADVLDGASGNDLFEWSTGDGNDQLSDTSTSTTEVDTLVLRGASSGATVLSKVGADLLVTTGAETITVKNRFNSSGDGRGIEMITFDDGVTMEVLAGPVASITTEGTASAQTLTGWAFSDVQYGHGGADILDTKAGDDSLYGGDGNDTLKGGTGSDTYTWSRGEDNDVIDDLGQSRTETDTLVLTDVNSPDDILLKRAQGSVDMTLSVIGSSEVLTIKNRFNTVNGAAAGYGIEKIMFADGTVWTLDEILANVRLQGGTGNDALTGTIYSDNIYGGVGNDTLTGGDGDDRIVGGAGDDLLRGVGHSDTYVWSVGHGNDTIDDVSGSYLSVDVLELNNVLPGDVTLTHASGSNNLVITIGTEILTILNRFSNAATPYGIDRIEFSDGTYWNIDEILAKTKMNGTGGNNVLTGSGYTDNMFGLAGSDTLNAGDGNDYLTGGTGNDSLAGGNGMDTYYWTKGHGNDTINDSGTSFAEPDRLILTNVASTEVGSTVSLTRASGSSNVLLKITGTVTEVITLTNQLNSTANTYGIEVIEFSDGVIWTFDDILTHVSVLGTASGNALSGTTFQDNIFGLAGNDTLTGLDGDDKLVGGIGADSLNGGNGVDTASYVDADQGVRVTLGVSTGQTGNAGGEEVGDILTSIEALEGSSFADTLTGNGNSNDLSGRAGDDSLIGKAGFDRLFGGDGNDSLDGGFGADQLTGGAGSDRFVFTEAGFGNDEIVDFEDGLDLLAFSLVIADDISDFTISGNGTSDVTVSISGNVIALHGTAPITLTADDFLFV